MNTHDTAVGVPSGGAARYSARTVLLALALLTAWSAGGTGPAARAESAPGTQTAKARVAGAVSNPDRVSVHCKDMSVTDAALTISRAAGRDVVVSKEVQGKVTLSVKDRSIEEVLTAVTTSINADFLRIGEIYYIASADELRTLAARMGEKRVVLIRHANPTEVESLLKARFPYLTAAGQATPKSVLLVGRSEDVEEAEGLVGKVDLAAAVPPPPPVALARVQEVLSLKHVNAAEVVTALEKVAPSVKTHPVGGGGKGLFVEASEPELALVKKVVQTLDVAQEAAPQPQTVEYYRVKYVSASTAEKTLKAAVPDVIVTIAPEAYAPPPAVFTPVATAQGQGGAGGGGLGSLGVGGGQGGIGGQNGQNGQNGQGNLYSPLERSRGLILQGPADAVRRAMAILDRSDIRPQQVAIEARIIEISPSQTSRLGIDWDVNGTLNLGLSGGKGLSTSLLSRGNLQINANVDFLIQNQVARIMANPRTVVQDNEDATIFIGDLLRYRVLREQTPFGNPVYDIESTPVGITLLVRPRVNADGEITLKIHPAVSTAAFLDGLPQTKSREVDTTVRLQSGDVFAIGGLIRDEETKEVNKLPLLGDLPLVGNLFRRTIKDRRKTEVVIFIQARLVE